MKPKQSSPKKDELGIIDFTPTVKPKKANVSMWDEDRVVKDDVESLFTVLGQALCVSLSGLARLQREVMEGRDG